MAGQPLQEPSGESAEQPWRSSLDALEAALGEAARAIAELRFSLEGESAAPSESAAVPDDPEAGEKSQGPAEYAQVWERLKSERAAPSEPAAVPDDPEAGEKSQGLADFQRVWARLERERGEPSPARAEQDDLSKPSDASEPSAPDEEPAADEKSERLAEFQRVWQRLERDREEPSAAGSEHGEPSEPSEPISPSEPGEPHGLKLLPSDYLMTIEDRDTSVDLITLQRGLLNLAPMENIKLVTYAKGIPVISLRFEGELDIEQLGEAVGNATGRRCEVIPQDGNKLFLRLTSNDEREEDTA